MGNIVNIVTSPVTIDALEVADGGSIVGDVSITGSTVVNGGSIKGNIFIQGSILEVGNGGSIVGDVQFGGALLRFDTATSQLAGIISGFGANSPSSDEIDLRFHTFAAGDKLVWEQNGPTGTLSLETSGGSVLASLKLSGSYTQSMFTAMSDSHGGTSIEVQQNVGGAPPVSAAAIESDTLAITRTALPPDQATSIADSINADTQTEAQYVSGLLSQASNTTIPAVAVEGSMYGMVGTSAEVTSLATQFLPDQVAFATQHGLNAQVYASEALGLALAFGNETGSATFATNFGPSNAAMGNSTAGDLAFATAAATAVFGSASTANLVNVIDAWVTNWKAFYTSNGLPGIANATFAQIDLAARGAAWGDAVGVALDNNLGPLKALATNFLMDAAEGIASYSVSLVGQPAHHPFQGEM